MEELSKKDLAEVLSSSGQANVVGTYWPRMHADYHTDIPDEIEESLKLTAAKIVQYLEPSKRAKIIKDFPPEYIIFYHDHIREIQKETFSEALYNALVKDPVKYNQARKAGNSKRTKK